VPVDPRKLKPTELVRLMTYTPPSEVIPERQLHRYRSRAGFHISDGCTVDEWKPRVDGLDNHWLDGLVGRAGGPVPGREQFGSDSAVRRRENRV
jgi:hypothetical protein